MKTLFTAIVFVFSLHFGTAHAQTTFAPPGAEWYHHAEEGVFHCYNAGDSIILGKNCTKIRQDAIVPPFAWTTDGHTLYTYISGDTVYIYNLLLSRFTPLYIFNLNDGDTVRIPTFYETGFSPYDSIFSFRVDSVRMVLYDTAYLKTVFTSILMVDSPYSGGGVYPTYNGAYAEKIGCVRNGIYPSCLGCPIPLGGVSRHIGNVRCYSDASMTVKLVSGPCLPPISAGGLQRDTSPIAYPNPANDVINIATAGSGSITIMTIAGKVIMAKRIDKRETSINVSALQQGMYLLRISDETNVAQYTRVQIVH